MCEQHSQNAILAVAGLQRPSIKADGQELETSLDGSNLSVQCCYELWIKLCIMKVLHMAKEYTDIFCF